MNDCPYSHLVEGAKALVPTSPPLNLSLLYISPSANLAMARNTGEGSRDAIVINDEDEVMEGVAAGNIPLNFAITLLTCPIRNL